MLKALVAVVVTCTWSIILASDLVRAGSSSATMASGCVIGLIQDALTALSGNPAYLAGLGNSNQLSLAALLVDSEFTSSSGEATDADKGPGLLPEAAISRRLTDPRWTFGAGLNIRSAMRADFQFVDPPGTNGVSYGRQTHSSEYAVVELSGALAYQLTDSLSLGASLGLAYNRNLLEAPYIFQSHPVLRGLKVLVDLDTDDLALASNIGLHYQINRDWSFNLAYAHEVSFTADGELTGNLAQLGLGIREDFAYNVSVKTALPSTLIAGLSWQATDRLQLGIQLDSIGWENSFDALPIRLTGGANQDLNAFLGDDFINDTAPLNWKDQRVIHLGSVYTTTSGRTVRAGFEKSNVTVPRSTMTPMTGSILDTVYSLGTDFSLATAKIDIAYRYSRGSDRRVTNSALLAGEYSGTELSLALHSLILSVSF